MGSTSYSSGDLWNSGFLEWGLGGVFLTLIVVKGGSGGLIY